jgi:prepilin-type N-terminal cleavage/methylation domain-containing protein
MTDNRGFTLIEVLVAAGILGMVATALFGLLSTSLSNLHKVEEMHQYELAAEDTMDRVLFQPTLPVPSRAEGSLDSLGNVSNLGNSGGHWTVNIDPWAPPKLENAPSQVVVKVHVVVSWPGRVSERSIELETLKATKIENYDLENRIQTAYPR